MCASLCFLGRWSDRPLQIVQIPKGHGLIESVADTTSLSDYLGGVISARAPGVFT